MLFHMHAIQPITCYSTNYCSLDYIEVASLSVRAICLTKPLKGKTLHWSDQFEVTNHSLTFLRVSVFVYMCVCVWQWPLASNCLFPVQTNKAGEGEGEDGISLMYTYIYIYTVSEATRQTSWVQWHNSSTQLWRDNMSFWLLWTGKKIHVYTIVLANGDHFKSHTHCCLGMVPTALCKQETSSACYYRYCWNVGI